MEMCILLYVCSLYKIEQTKLSVAEVMKIISQYKIDFQKEIQFEDETYKKQNKIFEQRIQQQLKQLDELVTEATNKCRLPVVFNKVEKVQQVEDITNFQSFQQNIQVQKLENQDLQLNQLQYYPQLEKQLENFVTFVQQNEQLIKNYQKQQQLYNQMKNQLDSFNQSLLQMKTLMSILNQKFQKDKQLK